MSDAQSPEVSSPCMSVCVLDEENICLGCYRSVEEITDWTNFNNTEKKRVLEQALERERAIRPNGLR